MELCIDAGLLCVFMHSLSVASHTGQLRGYAEVWQEAMSCVRQHVCIAVGCSLVAMWLTHTRRLGFFSHTQVHHAQWLTELANAFTAGWLSCSWAIQAHQHELDQSANDSAAPAGI